MAVVLVTVAANGEIISQLDIRELYPNYWVLVDNENGSGDGIFGTPLKSVSLTDAIEEAKISNYYGEGVKFNAQYAKLVYSIGNVIHIFEIC